MPTRYLIFIALFCSFLLFPFAVMGEIKQQRNLYMLDETVCNMKDVTKCIDGQKLMKGQTISYDSAQSMSKDALLLFVLRMESEIAKEILKCQEECYELTTPFSSETILHNVECNKKCFSDWYIRELVFRNMDISLNDFTIKTFSVHFESAKAYITGSEWD